MYEPFKRSQKEEEKEKFGGTIKKIVAVGAAVTALAGAAEYGKSIIQNDKNIINNDKTELDEKIKMEEALQKLINNPRSGYANLEHYLEDHRNIVKGSKEYEEIDEYFKTREEK